MATRSQHPGAQEWVPALTDDDGARQLARLREAAPGCRGCELWEPATQVVLGAGNPAGRALLVGEQPGDVEDQRGLPFVGPAGKVLQRALDEAGVARSDVYVTNAVKHFRFEERGKRRIHRTPELAHMTACRPWLVAEIASVSPEVLVVLGATAARTLLGPAFRVTRERGTMEVRDTAVGPMPVLATIHPSAVLRAPEEERDAAYRGFLTDLTVLARALDGAA